MPTITDINGNLNYKIEEFGAYHMIGDDAYEPQRNNNFELHIYFDDNNSNGEDVRLRTVEKQIIINKDIAERTLILSTVSVGALNTNVSTIPISYGNTKVKFAGLPDVQDTSITYNDYIGKATERIITAWHAQVFNPMTQVIGRASVYKKRALLVETAPDGSNVRGWLVKGCFPTNLTFGEYSYQNGGQVRNIQMALTYDIMIPLDSDDASAWSGIRTTNDRPVYGMNG